MLCVLYDLEHQTKLVGAIKFSRKGQNSVECKFFSVVSRSQTAPVSHRRLFDATMAVHFLPLLRQLDVLLEG